MIGADVGNPGEREFQSQTTGRLGASQGRYRAIEQEFELEFVPARNFRIEAGAAFAAHNIAGVPDLENRRQLALQGASIDFRYRFLDRQAAPFGLTVGLQSHADRVDDATAEAVRSYGTELTLAVDRELVANAVIAAVNLIYQPEWTRVVGSGRTERESTAGVALGMMARVSPGILLGGEARYLRRYQAIGLDDLSGQALFVGPTVYVQLSKVSWLTASWSSQAWGRPAGAHAGLDLVDFQRHQARLVFGVNF
ncbi:hypothetical protein P3G22_14765 [Rhodopseudomonas sp. BAL398]|nr:hypothetical protein [Rhodopseudomonas sp. BAL398]